MLNRFNHAIAICAISYSALPCSLTAQPATKQAIDPEQDRVIAAVETFLDACSKDDLREFHSVTEPSFYIFDGGVRYDGEAIMAVIKQMHAAGKQMKWTVTTPEVHVLKDTAWITYTNRAVLTDGSGAQQKTFLESAFFTRDGGTWKYALMHSTPAMSADAPQP